jgi:hypothetical protein
VTAATARIVVPSRIRALRRDQCGRPIPWFADDQMRGQANHAAASTDKRIAALRGELCWICGQRLPTGQRIRKTDAEVPFTFLMPAVCVIDRTAIDPPAHEPCAEYAARACPFLLTPAAGGMVTWSTTSYRIERPLYGGNGRTLLKLGEPRRLVWWRQGRPASRVEAAEELVAAGTRLRADCRYDPDPASARGATERRVRLAMRLLPTG